MPECDDDIEDMEDLVGEGDLSALERSAARANTVVKRVNRRTKTQLVEKTPLIEGSMIPGTQRVWVKTWGCAHNNSDSEYMAGQLAAYGYTITGKRHCSETILK